MYIVIIFSCPVELGLKLPIPVLMKNRTKTVLFKYLDIGLH